MFHARKFFLATLLLCLFAKGVSAGLILQGNDAAHIALGNQFSAVGAVQGTNSANVTGLAQSMSLIQSQWGLASKHGFLDSANGNSLYTNLRVSFDGNFRTANTWYNIAEVFLHPTKDMALIRFEVPVQNITPFDLFTGTVGSGTEGYTVGYGMLHYLNDANATFTGDRRAGFDVVDGVNPFEAENFATTFNRTINSNYRTLEMGVRDGDSGGAFISNNLLTGIVDSRTLTNGFNTQSYYTRLDNDWINATITAVPEPGSMVLMAACSGLFLWRRLRRKVA